ncbi:MAG: LysM peptidoglycan-binding domain-containing protein [Bacteroidetes bacterium]|nr:MAG: LysM peptidoglycan-binding domain-containing protein [Bacteroidota bacterium]
MKLFQLLLFVLFFFMLPEFSTSQNLKENELVVIQGEKFILHQVRTGETVYSISRYFKTESAVLLKHNPTISEGLSIGEILKIPYNENISLSEIPDLKKGDPTGFASHTVESNSETAYSISKRYGITVEEIYAYNPTVQRLRRGMVLKIPQWDLSAKPQSETAQKPVSEVGIPKQTEMLEHTVVSGETLYSISKKYQVTENDILNYNPEARNLKAGSILYLPKKQVENNVVDWVSESNVQVKYFNHTIVSGETLYGISQKYDVTEEELKAINPELKFAFRSGAVIRIPVQATKKMPEPINNNLISEKDESHNRVTGFDIDRAIPENCIPEKKIGSSGNTVIALFLPLFLEANEELNRDFLAQEIDSLVVQPIDTLMVDTIIEHEKPVRLLKQFHGNSENFLQFYEGVLIAVDSMQKAGMNVVLNVFDTKDNPETVRMIKNSRSFAETDLIIGPVYENVQKEVTQISVQNQIPMISPFTPKSAILDSNPWFYQINPTREYLAEATAELIADNYSNSNFIVVRTSSYPGGQESQLVELIRRKLAVPENSGKGKFTEYDFRKGRSQGLVELLLPDKENVVFLPSSDEGELSVAISNINNLAVDFPITLIGAANYQQRYPSIEIAHFHNLQMKYINPYWIDYQKPETIGYFEKFIENFGTEPNSYGVQGFDATWYFLNALHFYGKDFESCLPYMNVNLVQGNYYFKRVSPAGGYMNRGVSVISYNKNFDVERQSVIGQPQSERTN